MRISLLGMVVVLVMTLCFIGAAFADYSGMGLAGNPISVRQGSSNGIIIMGGGPGSGK